MTIMPLSYALDKFDSTRLFQFLFNNFSFQNISF